MRRSLLAVTILSSLAVPAAGEPRLALPVDCTLGVSCYIQQYLDHDSGPDFSDFRCAAQSYDTHSGTDFALPTTADAHRGVDVIAAASGTVLGVRDEMDDVWSGKINRATLKGRDCGNGVVIDHGDGWHTQYCHLKKGSVVVSKGQSVTTGTALGQIGMSGRTQFPHLHLTVRKNGASVDPFAPDGPSCSSPPKRSLWAEPIPYQPGGLLDIGFTTAAPDFSAVKSGTADKPLHRLSPAIVAYFYAFSGRPGDRLNLSIKGPGDFLVTDSYDLPRNRALYFRALGKKRRQAAWPDGIYTATAHLLRDGHKIDSRTAHIEIPR